MSACSSCKSKLPGTSLNVFENAGMGKRGNVTKQKQSKRQGEKLKKEEIVLQPPFILQTFFQIQHPHIRSEH